ncbi:hypothetical protein PLICRDRAFT_175093 [Plicaturopsis crispa FD-325 SS-3]|nr:hypothetical protein PLICRDRAFT_175093 [Plicaturopsis crispa FD-325 SS-3]
MSSKAGVATTRTGHRNSELTNTLSMFEFPLLVVVSHLHAATRYGHAHPPRLRGVCKLTTFFQPPHTSPNDDDDDDDIVVVATLPTTLSRTRLCQRLHSMPPPATGSHAHAHPPCLTPTPVPVFCALRLPLLLMLRPPPRSMSTTMFPTTVFHVHHRVPPPCSTPRFPHPRSTPTSAPTPLSTPAREHARQQQDTTGLYALSLDIAHASHPAGRQNNEARERTAANNWALCYVARCRRAVDATRAEGQSRRAGASRPTC